MLRDQGHPFGAVADPREMSAAEGMASQRTESFFRRGREGRTSGCKTTSYDAERGAEDARAPQHIGGRYAIVDIKALTDDGMVLYVLAHIRAGQVILIHLFRQFKG